jgi:hypothetical protein
VLRTVPGLSGSLTAEFKMGFVGTEGAEVRASLGLADARARGAVAGVLALVAATTAYYGMDSILRQEPFAWYRRAKCSSGGSGV